jgi:hypothetical protein
VFAEYNMTGEHNPADLDRRRTQIDTANTASDVDDSVGPGTSLAGWLIAALAMEGTGASNSGVAFILGGTLFGAALWTFVGVCSIPFFLLIKPWIAHLRRRATRLRGSVLAAAGAIPFVLIAIICWLALPLEKSAETRSTVGEGAVLALGVTFGLGTVAAAERWNLEGIS